MCSKRKSSTLLGWAFCVAKNYPDAYALDKMMIFLLVMIFFPLLVAVLLKSKYIYGVIALACVNLAILAFDYFKYMRPESRCISEGQFNCGDHSITSLILITIIIIVSVVAWYLAFKQKDNISGLASNGLAKKTLTAGGWIIVIFVVLTIAGFVVAFSQI